MLTLLEVWLVTPSIHPLVAGPYAGQYKKQILYPSANKRQTIGSLANKLLPIAEAAANAQLPPDTLFFAKEAVALAKRVYPELQETKGSKKFITLENITKEV